MKIINWILSFFRKPKTTKAKRKYTRQSKDNMGSLYYLGNLLDGLDDYFKMLRNLRRIDPEAYSLYRNFGGQVFNSDTLYQFSEKPEISFRKILPSFSMIHFNNREDDKDAKLSLTYVRKVKTPYFVEPTNGQTYVLGVGYDERISKKNYATTIKIYVSVDGEGNVQALRQRYNKHIKFPGRYNGGIIREVYGYPREFRSFIGEWKNRESAKKAREESGREIDIHEVARTFFNFCVNSYFNSFQGLQIHVLRGRDAATFNINLLRTPYFFKDRIKIKNKNGNTKKIFHIVKGHTRVTGQVVKSHFRGLRKFDWNGYNIVIQDPKGVVDPRFLDAESEEIDDCEPTTGKIRVDELGGQAANYLRA